MNATLEARELAVMDRCDVCGAQAYVRAVFESGKDLLFCGHHARAKESELRAVAVSVEDQTERLS